MKKINVLSPEVFNLLAAGEVVENPASIVKEAVENSLDAGATEIEIAIDSGGFLEIRVTDNGDGCAENQIEKVFLPHATSKIESAKDLEKILTLGFRGEALSSIASVSRVEFTSRVMGEDLATKVNLDSGSVLEKTKTAANQGTELIVRNLFYNVPARRKFLKTMKVEEGNVTGVVQKLILANPTVSFKYLADGEVVYASSGEGLLSAIETIYGSEVADELIMVSVSRGKLGLAGFISKPNLAKKNRTWQTVMVNGRVVDGGTVGTAANDAFSNYMMVGAFPFFVLDLKIDESAVDVNVHPRKAQVKFEDERGVYDFVKSAVAEGIDKDFTLQALASLGNIPATSAVSQVRSADNVLTLLEKAGKFEVGKDQKNLFEIKHQKVNPYYERRSKVNAVQEKINDHLQPSFVSKELDFTSPSNSCGVETPAFDGKILGTVMDTYILAQSGECLYIIDQHAAHERLLFDELTKQIDSGKIVMQPLLEPAVLHLSPAEMTKVLEIAPSLNKIGIECEVFGKNSFRITAVPMVVSVRGIDTVITNVLSEIKGAMPSSLSDIVREKVITECCRSAIKGGQHLTTAQVGVFLQQFKDLKVPLCPHGRPVVVAMDRRQLERLFKRI